jgi:regulator of cell morphogenesis and NO signaling
MANTATNQSSWAEQEPGEIIELIIRKYHEPLRRDLPALVARARAVESENREHTLCPLGLAAHLEQIQLEVESHLQKEEKILFPLILGGRGGMAFMPIKMMMAEHDDHLTNLERTATLAHGFVLPASASPAWRELYGALGKLDSELRDHIDLENNVLFPRVLGGDTGAR